MTKAKYSKSKWWAVLLGIVAVAAMGVTFWLVLSPRQEPAVMELVEEQDPALAPGNTSYLIAGGLDHSASLPTPMPYYGFSMPEGYTPTPATGKNPPTGSPRATPTSIVLPREAAFPCISSPLTTTGTAAEPAPSGKCSLGAPRWFAGWSKTAPAPIGFMTTPCWS